MILAVDCGSTSFKAAVFDGNLNVLAEYGHRLNYLYPHPAQVEIESNEVFKAFRSCVKNILADSKVSPSSLKAIAFTSQAQTFSVFDRYNIPRTNFISWLDQRAENSRDYLTERLPDFAEHCSFGSVLGALQICLLKHLQRFETLSLGKDDKIVSLVSALSHKLSGEFFLDENLAAMQGFYSLKDGKYWDDALAVCELRSEQLPAVVKVGTVAAKTSGLAGEYGLPAGIPIISAGNDQTAGAYGVELHRHKTFLVTLGTAYVAYGLCESLPVPSADYIRGIYPGGRFYCMGADSCGANITDWAAKILCPHQQHDPDAIFDLAASVDDSQGVTFSPELINSSGGWSNLGLQHSPAHLARAVLESLIRRVNGMLNVIGTATELPESILTAGGHSKSACYLEMLKKIIGHEFKPTTANPLLGAARMAQQAVAGSPQNCTVLD